VGLASIAVVVGIRAWSPARNVSKAEVNAPAVAPSLEEQQEASAIRELALGGRSAEAKLRADRFLARYPESPLAESVRLSVKQ